MAKGAFPFAAKKAAPFPPKGKMSASKDMAMDKKAGIKPGSKKDMALDKKRGVSDAPMFKKGGAVKKMKGC